MNVGIDRIALLCAFCCSLSWVTAVGQEDDDFDRTPKKCINISRIDRTQIIDENTILFHMAGDEIYRNYLPNGCPGMKPRDPFLYSTTNRELCDVDSIELLQGWGSQLTRGRSCRLGLFYPITEEEVEELENWPTPAEIEAKEPEREPEREEDAESDSR